MTRDTRVPHPDLPGSAARDGWAPASPCTPDCLPATDSLPRVGDLRVAARLAGLVTMLTVSALIAMLLPLFGRRRTPVLRGLFRSLLWTVGVRVRVEGPVREIGVGEGTGVLVVANHLSWLDILVLGAVHPMRMVAKAEIEDWPMLGALARRIGTLFIDRHRLRTLPGVVDRVAGALRDGGAVGLFPEGTTWCGAASGEFRRAGFQAALDAEVPVRPVSQLFRLPDGTPTTVGAFIGEDTLLDSLLRVLRLPRLLVEVQVLPLLAAGPGTDRRELARRAERAIGQATGVAARMPVAAGGARAGVRTGEVTLAA
ncbi:MAG TPA: lysophospholipid acyltransferase family protein [Pseudonocardia sp.]